jgi:hypothetical protein
MREFATLFQAPSPAVLTTYRKDGKAVTSPVWFRFRGDTFEVVIAENDVKLRHLAARRECELLVFETVPPFRGHRWRRPPPMTSSCHGATCAMSGVGRVSCVSCIHGRNFGS